jgi:hypothetical protein
MAAYKAFVTQWISRLRSRRSQSGEFEYKSLLIYRCSKKINQIALSL